MPSLLTALREATAACASASASNAGPPLAPLQRALRLASQLLQYAEGRPQAPNLQRAVVELAQVGTGRAAAAGSIHGHMDGIGRLGPRVLAA